MKTFTAVLFCFLLYYFPSDLNSQLNKPMIIDHKSTDLYKILENDFVKKAIAELYIGYGHTSHGSQLITGMDALMAHYVNGNLKWSRNGGPGYLRIVEGGTLSQDVGYTGWDDKTRTYLDNTPKCNVIVWSWCGQVNDVDLNSHYLQRMNKLELDYPKVKFVYMTGHLEGQGPKGSLEMANNTIRQFCIENNKILFDFADIEKYSPDGDINYDEYFADDACNYKRPDGKTGNWADEWLQTHPNHILTMISSKASGCAHSVSLNCVIKGIASWHLWARIAGWDGDETSVGSEIESNKPVISPNPASEYIEISFDGINPILKHGVEKAPSAIKISNTFGECVLTTPSLRDTPSEKGIIRINISHLPVGLYFIQIGNYSEKFVVVR